MNDFAVRCNGLSLGWAESALGEIAEINPALDISKLSRDLSVSFVPMPAVEALTGQIDTSNLRRLSEVAKGYTRFAEGDVLFAKITPCMENGKIAIANNLANRLGFGSTEFHVIRPKNGISNRYIFYYLLQDDFRNTAEHNMKGTAGQRRVPADFLDAAPIPIPPFREQERIVAKIDELFSELDAGVASLKRARALLKKYRQAVLKAAVTGELTRDWRERHKGQIEETGADLLQRILKARREAWEAAELKKLRAKGKPPKDDRWKQKYKDPQPPDTASLPALPEGWMWISLDQLLTDIEAGKNFRCEERPPAAGEAGVVKVSSVTWGVFNENESKTITDQRRIDLRYTIRPGDFLFSRANTSELVGACVIVGEFRKHLLLSDKILRLRFAHDLHRWVDVCLKSQLGRAQIEAMATGNQLSMRNISQPSIRRLTIPLPPREEVEVAVDALEAEQSKVKEASFVIDEEVRRSKALRQSILKAAFAGKLVPQDPNDEPASVLLERIRAERAARSKPARGRRPRQQPAAARQLELLR